MTIEDDEVSLGYLLDPCFELSNSEGKPLTGGYIELYIHGTRNKYYAASDFEGTLHPFQIPLDSLGSNIVLVNPSFSYDIYVYNRFGNLVMSRYNVCAIGAGGGSSSTVSIESSDGTVEITATSSGYDLSVMDLYEAIQAVTASYATIEYVDNSVSSFVTEERVSTMIDEAISGYGPGEIYTGGQYVQITDENVINVTGLQPAGNYLTPEDLNGYATIEYVDNSVSSFTTHTEVYDATVTAIQAATAQMPDQLEAGDYVSIVNNTINVTGLQPAGDYATHTEVNEATVTAIQAVTGLIPDAQVQSDWAQSDDTKVDYIKNKPTEQNLVAGNGIDITVTGNNVVISSTAHGDVTEAEVYDATVTAIEYVTALIPETQVQSNWTEADPSDPSYIQNKPSEKQLVAGDGISITSNATGVIINSAVTSIEGYATEAYVTAAVAGKKDKQTALSFTNGDTWTVTGVYQDANGEIEVEWAPIPLDDFITEEQLIAAVSAVTGIGDYGRFYATDISGAATLQKVRGTLDVTNDGKIQLKQGGSYHVTVRGGYNQSVPTNEYTTANYIEYVTNSIIAINVDNTVTATQYFEISYDIYPLANDTNYYVFFSLPSNATITNLNIDVHAIGQVGTGNGGGGGSTEYDAGWGIQILNNTISVDPSIIPDVSDFVTESEVYDATVTAIEHVTAMIPAAQVQSDWTEDDTADPSYIQNKPSEKQLVAGDNITITSNSTGVIISATGGSGDVTEAMLYDATVTAVVAATGAIPAQVQSDWIEDDSADPSYIQNKPIEKELTAGQNISITETATSVVISAQGGGGSTYTAGNGIDITNDVISVDDTVAMASALPTTELGKFTIQNNVSGGPIEVIIPIDQGHAVYNVLMNSDSVSGTYEISGGYKGVLFKSPGYDNDYWDYSAGSVIMHVPEAITGIANIYACYAHNSYPTGSYATGPNFFSNYPWYNPDKSTYTLLPGDYEIATRANQVPQSTGGYGKYISVVANGPGSGPDINALSKISFAGIERHPELGYDVNLDRYALGNTYTITNTSGYSEAAIYTDPITKKQSVYLPNNMPSNWTANNNIIQSFKYGSLGNSPFDSCYVTSQYRAYKYTSSPRRYQFAYCTDWDYANKVMTFIAYDDSGNAIEKWTLDYTTYGSNVWTTSPIETGSTYTAGQYISIDANDVISVTGLAPVSGSDGIAVNNNVVSLDSPIEIVAGDNITISVTGASAIISAQGGSSTYSAGNGIDITNDVISIDNTVALKTDIPVVTGFATVSQVSAVSAAIPELPDEEEVEFEEIDISAFALASSVPTVGLNGNDQVTGINGHEIAGTGGGGTTYTAGQYISIDANDVISVTGVAAATAIPESEEVTFEEIDLTDYALASAIPDVSNFVTDTEVTTEITEAVSGKQDMLTGITDVQVVTGLPVSPTQDVLYLIVEA